MRGLLKTILMSCLVIGTSAAVYPAAGYVNRAKKMRAVVAVINPDPTASQGLDKIDFFEADAVAFLPLLLEDVIGKLPVPQDAQ
jgi:NAD-dependent deacetylase sirtuin 5